jgi:hypothetical protein
MASVSWTIRHKLNTKFIAMDVMKLGSGGVYEKTMPTKVDIIDDNTLRVTFNSILAGRARIVTEMI